MMLQTLVNTSAGGCDGLSGTASLSSSLKLVLIVSTAWYFGFSGFNGVVSSS
jgi:hypothetical protein